MKRSYAAIAAMFVALSTGAASAAQLPHAAFTITSALSVDATAHTVTLPLYRGTAAGQTVWYILTDASTPQSAKKYGVNYAPSLAQLASAATQTATKQPDSSFAFQGAPNFAPARTYVAGKGGFPPDSATPGGKAGDAYSPFVRVVGSNETLNAPIVATGNGGFDVTTHANTEDRVVAIDTAKKTVTLVLARGFVAGKPVLYLSTEASDPVASSVERATYVPKLAKANASAIPIGVILNGPQTGDAPQGLAYLALRTPLADDATAENLATIASSFNVLSLAPNLADPYAANGYTPLWAPAVVGATQAKRLTNYAQVAPLAKPAGFLVNCPVVAYGD